MAGQPTQEALENGMYANRVGCTSANPASTATHNHVLQQNLSPTERALYAALAPSQQTAPQLKAASRTWADQLWAIVSIACEERLTVGLATLARESFWEGGLAAVEAPSPEQAVDADVNENQMETEEEDWEKEVLGELESLNSVVVEEGYVLAVSLVYVLMTRLQAGCGRPVPCLTVTYHLGQDGPTLGGVREQPPTRGVRHVITSVSLLHTARAFL